MYRDSRIGVVVPAYNEEGLVGEVIDTMPAFVDRVYVVDDRSTDGTWDEIRRHAERANAAHGSGRLVETDGGTARLRRPDDSAAADDTDAHERESGSEAAESSSAFDERVVPIRLEENRGVGGAIKTGYERALADGIDVVAVMNGDGQMDPDKLDRLVDPVVSGEADYAKGNRLRYREYREGMSAWRSFGNWLLTLLTKAASGYWKTMDPQNGYTAISREALETIDYQELYERYGFCNDVLVKLNAHGLRVADVAIPAVYGDEESTIEYKTFVPRLSALLARDFLWRLRVKYLTVDFHPLAGLYLFGAAIAGAGVLDSLKGAVSDESDGSGGVLASIGIVSVLLAMVFDMQENEELEVRRE
ncbi:glycosyltransferase family 2 protein [Haloprofundus sp. MHR1]|uniref:glycosyltransferase family 2 protein n=1 Tax=Haloprofundus sp. MHR1 TaxID=2572921 RepID=UPI0010BF1B8A|nr:glycosyltransferase family 2 protein [Haloprofundus sp. MHR1]QCJ46691.1 glycosyltransferase family 2 protein [Haloprofundus sp. MHR1]